MFDPQLSEDTVAQVSECLRSGRISEGARVKEFERRFAEEFGLPRGVAVNSGTAGLHLAMLGAGVGPGDEVVTTAQTFVASAMAVLYAGGTPVFADIVPGGPNLDFADVERCVTPRTKAILVVHYGGYPCDMDEILAVANRHGLAVIEDAAHALGATYRDAVVGALGDFAVFSFQAIKHLTTGDGGMLVCRDEAQNEVARRRRWFGIDRDNRTPNDAGGMDWDISELGFKYHMNDVAAAIGLGQLPLVAEALARRQSLDRRYRDRLAGVGGLRLMPEAADRASACWLFTMLVENRAEFVRAMVSRGVEAGSWHRRVDTNSLFAHHGRELPNLQAFDRSQVSVPLRESLTDDEVECILEAVCQGW
jgi:perosamine synthetase